MTRKLIYTIVSLISVCIVAFLAVFLLLTSETVSRWLVHKVTTYIPGQLNIGRIQGSLLSDLNLYEVDQYVDQRHLQIQHVELNWQPMALLGRKILLRNLNITGITYTVEETKEISIRDTIKSLQNVTFPFSITVEEARLDHLNFSQGGNQLLLDYIKLAGRANQNDIWLKRLEAQGVGLHVDLQGHMSLNLPYPFQANVNWSTWLPSKVKIKGKCDISGDVNSLKFNHKLTEPLLLNTRGEVNIKCNLTKKEKTALYDINLKGDFTGPGLPPTYIDTHTQSDLKTFQIDSVSARTLGGMVKVIGHIDLQPEPKAELTVNALDIDPGAQWPGWHGKLAFNSKVQAKIDAGTPTVLLPELKLVGHFLDQPFQASGNLTLNGISLISGNLRIHSGENTLIISGTTAEHVDVKFDVDAPDPVSLWPGIRGHLKGKGIIKGTRTFPTGTITLEGINMSYGDYTLQNLHSDFTFDLNNMELSTARIKLANLRVGDEVLSSFTLNSVGNLKSHSASVNFVFPSARTDIKFAGNCFGDTWKIDVDKASFRLKQNTIWRLNYPIHLLMSHAELKPFKGCWTHEKSIVCVQSSWNEESGWKTEGDVNDAPLKDMIDLMRELFKEEHLGWGKIVRY